MKKRFIIGFKSIYLARITKDDAEGYQDAAPVALPFAGSMTMTPKESTQDIYYDDAIQVSLHDLKGYDVEIRIGGADLALLSQLGLGEYDPVTGKLEMDLIPTPIDYSYRFIADTVEKLPFAMKYRKFTVSSIRESGFNTRGDSIQVNEVVILGLIGEPMYSGAKFCAKLQMLADEETGEHTNQAEFDALVTGTESLPDAA